MYLDDTGGVLNSPSFISASAMNLDGQMHPSFDAFLEYRSSSLYHFLSPSPVFTFLIPPTSVVDHGGLCTMRSVCD